MPAVGQRVMILRTRQRGWVKDQWPRKKKDGSVGQVYTVLVNGKRQPQKFFEDEVIPDP